MIPPRKLELCEGACETVDLQSFSTATATSTPSAAPQAIDLLRAELMQNQDVVAQQPDDSYSSDSFVTASEFSGTTYSSASAPAQQTNPGIELRLRSRLADCVANGDRPRLRRWSDEDPQLENEAAEEVGTEPEGDDQRSLEEVLADVGLWSTGSARHVTGKCRPCHYVRSNTGCENGQSCEFCHFPHTGRSRRQLSMSSRLYCKGFADVLSAAYRRRPEQLSSAVATSSTGSSYLASIFEDRLRQLPGQVGSGELPEQGTPQMLKDAPCESQHPKKKIVSL